MKARRGPRPDVRSILTALAAALAVAWPAYAQAAPGDAPEAQEPEAAAEIAEEAAASTTQPADIPIADESADVAADDLEGEAAPPATAPVFTGAAVSPTAQELYDRFASQLAVVGYQVEVPGQNGGVRSAHQVGLVVSADGLLLLGGHLQALNMKPFNFTIAIGEEEYDGELLRREGHLNVTYVRAKPRGQTAREDAQPEHAEEEAGPEAGHNESAAERFTPIVFDEAVELGIGAPVWVLGILPEQAGYAVQMRQRRVAAILEEPARVYMVDGTPNPGENGALVLTAEGRPAGVLGYELSRQQGGEIFVRHGLPLIFPAALVNESLAAPRAAAAEKQKESWFGILIQPLTADFREYFELGDRTGCIISNVVPESPAAAAGLQRGDIIVEMNGDPVDIPNDLAVLTFTRSIRDLPIGTKVGLVYLRDGEERTTTVELSAIPKTAAKADTFNQPAWGLRVRELTNDILYLLNLPKDLTGVVVDHVEQGGPAQAAGLQPGDVIRELNSLRVESLGDYRDSTDQIAGMLPDKVVLFIQRGPRTGFTTLEPDWRLPAKD